MRLLSQAFCPARVRSRGPGWEVDWGRLLTLAGQNALLRNQAGTNMLQAEKKNVCFFHSREHRETEFRIWNIETILSQTSLSPARSRKGDLCNVFCLIVNQKLVITLCVKLIMFIYLICYIIMHGDSHTSYHIIHKG